MELGGIMKKLFRDLKQIFFYSNNYIKRDSEESKKRVWHRMAEVNCRRILGMMPLFLALGIFNIVDLTAYKHQQIYVLAAGCFIVYILTCAISCGVIVYNLHISRVKNLEEMQKYKTICRTFWVLWIIEMAIFLSCRIITGRGIVLCVIINVAVCIVPLYDIGGFVCVFGTALVTFAGMSMLNVFRERPHIEGYITNQKAIFYICLTVLLMGFIVQRFAVKMRILQEYVYEKTFMDPLTGLLNRRGGDALFEEEMEGRKGSIPIGVIMLDIDFFKKYNDMLGHDVGDECLAEVAEILQKEMKNRTKILIRQGGEEFVVILFDTDARETQEYADRIRKVIYLKGIEMPYKEIADVVTVSVGASVEQVEETISYESFLKNADMALYEAKEGGRNRTVFHAAENV